MPELFHTGKESSNSGFGECSAGAEAKKAYEEIRENSELGTFSFRF